MKAIIEAVESLGAQHYLFRLKPEVPFLFKAGQFLVVAVPAEAGAAPESKALKGYYSLASAEQNSSSLEILVERRDGYLSQWICGRQAGESLSFEGPLGKFALEEPHQVRQIFIGEGAGLAPLRSMILSLLEKKTPPQIDLFQTARLEGDLLFDLAWERLEERHTQFHYHPLVADGPQKGDAAAALSAQIRERQDLCIYLAGFKVKVESLLHELVQEGFPKERIRVESFG